MCVINNSLCLPILFFPPSYCFSCSCCSGVTLLMIHPGNSYYFRADSRFAPSQWETALLCNDISHWLGANLESALLFHPSVSYDTKNTRNTTKMLISPMTTRLWRDMCLSDIWHTFPQTCGLMIHISSTSHEIWTSFCCALCCALLWLCYVFLVDFCLPISLTHGPLGDVTVISESVIFNLNSLHRIIAWSLTVK